MYNLRVSTYVVGLLCIRRAAGASYKPALDRCVWRLLQASFLTFTVTGLYKESKSTSYDIVADNRISSGAGDRRRYDAMTSLCSSIGPLFII